MLPLPFLIAPPSLFFFNAPPSLFPLVFSWLFPCSSRFSFFSDLTLLAPFLSFAHHTPSSFLATPHKNILALLCPQAIKQRKSISRQTEGEIILPKRIGFFPFLWRVALHSLILPLLASQAVSAQSSTRPTVPSPPHIRLQATPNVQDWKAYPTPQSSPSKKQQRPPTRMGKAAKYLELAPPTPRLSTQTQLPSPHKRAQMQLPALQDPKSLGLRIRLFRIDIEQKGSHRQMLGEIWLLQRPLPPSLLGVTSVERYRLKKLWRTLQKAQILPAKGPYTPKDYKALRRYLESQGFVLSLHPFPPQRKE
jgi:hypothetical protein